MFESYLTYFYSHCSRGIQMSLLHWDQESIVIWHFLLSFKTNHPKYYLEGIWKWKKVYSWKQVYCRKSIVMLCVSCLTPPISSRFYHWNRVGIASWKLNDLIEGHWRRPGHSSGTSGRPRTTYIPSHLFITVNVPRNVSYGHEIINLVKPNLFYLRGFCMGISTHFV